MTRRAVKLAVGLSACLAILCACSACAVGLAADPVTTVRLVIDYGDGSQLHFTAIPWREGMTALDALNAVKAHRHGVSFAQRGSGRLAMITKIGDQENEGGRSGGKNWLFYRNEKPAEVGAGALTLEPGDSILWRFQTYDYNSSS